VKLLGLDWGGAIVFVGPVVIAPAVPLVVALPTTKGVGVPVNDPPPCRIVTLPPPAAPAVEMLALIPLRLVKVLVARKKRLVMTSKFPPARLLLVLVVLIEAT